MKKILMTVLLGLTSLGFNAAWAHGDAKPRHGGVVREVSDLSFELVSDAKGVAIYVEDHGQPMAPTGMSGKLTVLKGSEKTDYPLVAGADRLEAAGAQLPKGAKAVAVINGAGKKTLTVRYTLK